MIDDSDALLVWLAVLHTLAVPSLVYGFIVYSVFLYEVIVNFSSKIDTSHLRTWVFTHLDRKIQSLARILYMLLQLSSVLQTWCKLVYLGGPLHSQSQESSKGSQHTDVLVTDILVLWQSVDLVILLDYCTHLVIMAFVLYMLHVFAWILRQGVHIVAAAGTHRGSLTRRNAFKNEDSNLSITLFPDNLFYEHSSWLLFGSSVCILEAVVEAMVLGMDSSVFKCSAVVPSKSRWQS